MKHGTALVVGVALCAALLSACTESRSDRSGPDTNTTFGPTVTTTAAPPEAAALADRYRAAGGDADVYGLETRHEGNADAPLIILRTHNADTEAALFDRQAASVTAFLSGHEGVRMSGGYRMDVYGPDGSLLHRWDATP